MTLKHYPLAMQPYEKMSKFGPKALATNELLSIIINSGTSKLGAIDIANNILAMQGNGLINLHTASIEELTHIDGIGPVKAIRLKALAELSIRFTKANHSERPHIDSPKALADIYMEEMRHLSQEQFRLVVFDTKNNIIKDTIISIGTVSATLVNPREVLIYCLKNQGVQYAVMHNHPSGDPTPSKEDILLTKRLKKAGDLIGITLLDHIIIGNLRYTSLKEEGII